jgi:hypothetical protein
MLTQNPDLLPSSVSGQHQETEDKMAELSDKIQKLVDEAEQAGCNGNVDDVRWIHFGPLVLVSMICFICAQIMD